ncbi:hypothetical protein GCM10010402_38020 [Actinomadura luteofluorescens]|uniref:hypothetical protein n=1 Tax=Actinomadura luteofluorescens TaxID=46163 RepID=UPI00216488FE|nr:hypothetical protein [Actinomadura glauciflava]MCR3745631.1 hypothetical protein [Actinomadura glauciflava]
MEEVLRVIAEMGPAAVWVAGFVAAVIATIVIYLGLALVAVLRAQPNNEECRYVVFRDLLDLLCDLLSFLRPWWRR